MKTPTFFLWIATFIALSFLGACMHREKRPERVEAEVLGAKEKNADAEASGENEMDYRTQSEARLYENARDIALLKDRNPGAEKRIVKTKKALRAANEKKQNAVYKARIDSLERKNNELRVRLNSYKEKDKTRWNEFKKQFSGDLDQLRQALKDIGNNNAEDDSKN